MSRYRQTPGPLWFLAVVLFLVVPAFTIVSCTPSDPSVSATVKGPTAVPDEDPTPSTDGSACSLDEREQHIAHLMATTPKQQRPHLNCNPTLVEVARKRAQDMAARDYFAHTTPDGYGPNHFVREAGYPLPSRYSVNRSANNVESIGAGYVTAEGVWKDLLNSPSHRTHLLGELSFYANQVEYGIGYAKGGSYGHYWVIITAKPASSYASSQ